ncbi:septal ring lytic transglycosylase RlpA family protein [Brevundimonas sp.]|uniref:septal ring lytic transglycosylase RlpA family protein n=2 Tax=Brevundimonas sp. TaxID=1871086 RepID=UPI002FC81A92
MSALVTLSACASAGGGKGGALPRDIPSVSDAAPFVSGTMRPYTIRGRTYRPAEQPDYNETGQASWYGQYHHGRSTSTGERFDMNALTAAHKTLPLPSMVEVTNPANGRRVLLRVNDRGPFVDSRIIDLSRGAADALGLLNQGVGEVRVRYAGRAPRSGGGMRLADVGSRGANQPAEQPSSVQNAPSSTARPYNEVARERPRQPARTQAATRPATTTNYPRTRRDVPIPDQPLPPLMPARNAPLVASAAVPAPVPVPVYTPPPVAPVPTQASGPYRVQVMSFEERAFADGIARRVGGDAVVESFERNGRTLYRVVVGSGADREGAERLRQAIIARGFADALLIAD